VDRRGDAPKKSRARGSASILTRFVSGRGTLAIRNLGHAGGCPSKRSARHSCPWSGSTFALTHLCFRVRAGRANAGQREGGVGHSHNQPSGVPSNGGRRGRDVARARLPLQRRDSSQRRPCRNCWARWPGTGGMIENDNPTAPAKPTEQSSILPGRPIWSARAGTTDQSKAGPATALEMA
jgi:hypothetical protein